VEKLRCGANSRAISLDSVASKPCKATLKTTASRAGKALSERRSERRGTGEHSFSQDDLAPRDDSVWPATIVLSQP
jgi:hypothetical protein